MMNLMPLKLYLKGKCKIYETLLKKTILSSVFLSESQIDTDERDYTDKPYDGICVIWCIIVSRLSSLMIILKNNHKNL